MCGNIWCLNSEIFRRFGMVDTGKADRCQDQSINLSSLINSTFVKNYYFCRKTAHEEHCFFLGMSCCVKSIEKGKTYIDLRKNIYFSSRFYFISG